jgi:predicted short-subunit dehydrogenase-like oxidoreductase (DUF2520 family)
VAIIKTVSFIGAGNVALHLAPALKGKGIRVQQVCNRSEKKGRQLAQKTGAVFVPDPALMKPDSDLIIIAVSDDAIAELSSRLRTTGLVVHTSGAAGLNVLGKCSPRTGVFYPLQTFRKGRRISLSKIPFCIEADSRADEVLLADLGMRLSGMVARLDSEQRRLVHLTAVFAANFTNYMYSAAEEILDDHGIPFSLLMPIILQTAGNAKHKDIFSLQTGPAVREDHGVMEMHRDLLKEHKDLRKIYDLISKSIIHQKRKHG